MKTKEIFHLGVRLLGLVFLYNGLVNLPGIIGAIAGAFPHEIVPGQVQGGSFMGLFYAVLMTAWPLFLAWWLIGGAPQIMRIAFPEPADTRPAELKEARQ